MIQPGIHKLTIFLFSTGTGTVVFRASPAMALSIHIYNLKFLYGMEVNRFSCTVHCKVKLRMAKILKRRCGRLLVRVSTSSLPIPGSL